MNLPNFSIRRPIGISMIFFIFLLLGIVSLFRLPVELKPDVERGNISMVLNVRGGISPMELEDSVSRPVEDALAVINGLEDIITVSEEGECRVVLYFRPEVDLDYAVVEVRERFAQIQDKLPKEVERPVIAKYEYSQMPVVILGVTSQQITVEDLRRLAEDKMKNRFSRIEGVAKIEIGGGREEKIFVEINEMALRSYGLTLDDITKTLNANNLNLVAGDVKKGGLSKYLVRTVGRLTSLEDIKSLPIINPEESSNMVRIGDIAKIGVSYLDPQALARVNSQPSISLYIQKTSGANTIKVVDEIEKEVAKLRKEFPKDINIKPYFNHAEYIKQAILIVRSALYLGALLTVLVLWLFLRNLKYTVIVAITIPFSVIAAFSLMYLTKITCFDQMSINVVTLSGIALGVGILVDSSIVVLENIFKKRESLISGAGINLSPENLKLTAAEGADEVFLAIVASTLTTVAVFVPLLFVNKEIQRLYSGLALTVTFILFTALFFSFTLVPLLASRVATKTKDNSPPPAASGDSFFEPPRKKNQVYNFVRKINFSKLGEFYYGQSVDFVLKKRYLFIAATVFLFLLAIIQISKLGREFIGIAEQNRFTVYVQMPSGTKIEISDEVVRKTEEILDAIPEIKDHTSRVKGWSSEIYVELRTKSGTDRDIDDIIEEIRQKTQGMDPAFIYAQQPESVGRKEIMVEVFGPDYDSLKQVAHQVGGKIQGVGKFKDVKLRMRSGRPEIHIILDRNKLAFHGLTVSDISNILHAKMRGVIATRFHTSSDSSIILQTDSFSQQRLPTFKEYGTRIFQKDLKKISLAMGGIETLDLDSSREIETITRLEQKFRDTVDDIYNISLRGKDKTMIYLQQVANLKTGIGPAEIWRKNKERMVQVSADTGRLALSESAELVNTALADLEFAKNYHYKIGGDFDKMIRNQRELTQTLLMALFLVYMVLASVFESFSQPFIVLTSVPMAVIGVGFGLKIADEPIGLGVYIGAVVLVGIVVNNAIILIDHVNRLQGVGAYKKIEKRVNSYEAVKEAVLWRLRPILMTSLTTILGMIPLIFQRGGTSSLWRPLAVTIVSGMTVSTFLTLFIIPAIYLVAEDIGKKLSLKRFFFKNSL